MPETHFDPSTETAPRDRLETLQLAKVKTLLSAVLASNPFYRTRLQRAGFTTAADLNSLADFLRAPVQVAALGSLPCFQLIARHLIDRRSYP